MFYPDRKNINHETIKQFVRDNFSQYAWKDIVLENSCGPIPQKPAPAVPLSKPASPKPASPKPASPKPASPKPASPVPNLKPKPTTQKAITDKRAKHNMTQKRTNKQVYVDILLYDDDHNPDDVAHNIETNMNIEFNNRASDSDYIYNSDTYTIVVSVYNKIAIIFNEPNIQYIQDIVKIVYEASGSKSNSFINAGIYHIRDMEDNIIATVDAPYAKPTTQKAIVDKRVKHNMTQKQTKKISALQHLKEYVNQGIPYLDNLSEDELSAMLLKANDAYTNSKPVITDTQYDLFREYIQNKYPDNEALIRIGAPVNQKNKVRLPYNMPSMDKIKADKGSLDGWTKKFSGPYVVSCKLDGVSGMYSTIGEPKLYTRGDGTVGQDISHLIDLLKLPKHKDIVVRGEFIIAKNTFEKNHATNYSNPRNMVAGVINSKTIGKRIKEIRDIEFVCYEIIHPVMKPSEQKQLLSQIGHKPVVYETTSKLSMEYLTNTLTRMKAESEYELDGIIVEDDEIHPRTANNPEHAFAFKMAIDEQVAETRVVDVEWAASQDGYLKPRVRVEPVNIGGVRIQYTTGFNGKFIKENGIGPGAIIQIIRSGDVIPYIKSVVEPVEPKMPDTDYVWTDTGVDIVVADIDNDSEVRARNIVGFFSDLGIDGLSTGNVTKIMNAGYKSVPAIIKMSKADLLAVPGFQEKMAEKIFTGIRDKLESVKLVQLMVASNKFGRGFGLKTIKPVMDAHPDFLTSDESRDTKIGWLNEAGINKSAATIVDAIPDFIEFLDECGLSYKLANAKSSEKNFDVNHPLYKKSVVMTKVRDQEIIEYLAKVGATLEDTIKKGNTVALIVKSKADVTNKTKDAEKKGVPIMTVDEFKEAYL